MKKYIYLFLMFLLLASCNIALQTEDDVENTSIIPRKETISNMEIGIASYGMATTPMLTKNTYKLPKKFRQRHTQ